MAADMNADGRVNVMDALEILKQVVGRPSAHVPEWMFVEETRDFWNDDGTPKLTRSAAQWDRAIDIDDALDASANAQINLVGVLKGDVNGSWLPPANSQDLDVIRPSYFTSLAARLQVPIEQWG